MRRFKLPKPTKIKTVSAIAHRASRITAIIMAVFLITCAPTFAQVISGGGGSSSVNLASPGPIGGTTPAAGTFTTATATTRATTPTRTTISGATTLGAQSYQILTMTVAATLTLPSGTSDGQSLTAKVCQNATGGFTPTWAGPISWPSGTAPTPTTTASKCDLYGWLWDATAAKWNETGFTPNE